MAGRVRGACGGSCSFLRPAMAAAHALEDADKRAEVLSAIAEAQLQAGDLTGAIKTIDAIFELAPRAIALVKLASALAAGRGKPPRSPPTALAHGRRCRAPSQNAPPPPSNPKPLAATAAAPSRFNAHLSGGISLQPLRPPRAAATGLKPAGRIGLDRSGHPELRSRRGAARRGAGSDRTQTLDPAQEAPAKPQASPQAGALSCWSVTCKGGCAPKGLRQKARPCWPGHRAQFAVALAGNGALPLREKLPPRRAIPIDPFLSVAGSGFVAAAPNQTPAAPLSRLRARAGWRDWGGKGARADGR